MVIYACEKEKRTREKNEENSRDSQMEIYIQDTTTMLKSKKSTKMPTILYLVRLIFR